MNFIEPHIEFDTKKPFYSIVVAYAAQVHGLLDLSARGMRNLFIKAESNLQQDVEEANEKIKEFCEGINDGYKEHVQAVLQSKSSPIVGVQRLGSVFDKGPKVNTSLLASAIISDPKVSMNFFGSLSAGALLIMAWELTGADHNHEPLWEFLRHCRNAAAHKGHFNLMRNEPRRLAQWRSLKIDKSLHGTLLFWDNQKRGFLGPGDAIYLLLDIEKNLLKT
ncbi:MAG: hypothetical protein IIA61_10015 [Candidatus Marinimicrobia bacterium]|nr:hypothetical protein [Candidatus Neomarinimicrobiota bacterium]